DSQGCSKDPKCTDRREDPSQPRVRARSHHDHGRAGYDDNEYERRKSHATTGGWHPTRSPASHAFESVSELTSEFDWDAQPPPAPVAAPVDRPLDNARCSPIPAVDLGDLLLEASAKL